MDSDNRTFRIAFPAAPTCPCAKTVDTRNANTRMRNEEIEYYSNYHPIDGIQTPFQITRERNSIKIYQVFFDKYEYNTSVADSFLHQGIPRRALGKNRQKGKTTQERYRAAITRQKLTMRRACILLAMQQYLRRACPQ